jgi:hypothetical protein
MAAADYVTLAELKAYILDDYSCTFTASAGTDKLTLASVRYANSLTTGAAVEVSTTGTLPAPLVADTVYYAILDADQLIQVAISSANASAGTQIDLTTAGTGVHTIFSPESDDALLEAIRDAAVSWLQRYTNREFVATADTRYYGREAVDGLWLYLDEDLYTLTSVANGNSSGTAIATADVTLFPQNNGPPYSRIRLDADSSSTWQTDTDYYIGVTGTWGYTATPPDDIKHAAKLIAKYLYDQRRTERLETIVAPNGSITIPQGTPETAIAILEHYRRFSL